MHAKLNIRVKPKRFLDELPDLHRLLAIRPAIGNDQLALDDTTMTGLFKPVESQRLTFRLDLRRVERLATDLAIVDSNGAHTQLLHLAGNKFAAEPKLLGS